MSSTQQILPLFTFVANVRARRTCAPRTVTALAAAAFAAIHGLTAAPAVAQSLVLTPVADTSIFLNNGSPEDLLSSGSGESIFTGHTSGQVDILQRGLIRFNVSSIPCGSTITGVELTMTLLRAAGGGGSSPVALHRLTASWGEGTSVGFGGSGAPSEGNDANWSERVHRTADHWSTPGGDFAALASATTGVGVESVVVWASTPGLIDDVSSWLIDPTGNFGWIMINDEASFSTARKLASRESPVPTARPSLRITYVPPCTADLAVGGYCPDGVVDGSDFITFINSFSVGDASIDPVSDINGDGIVDGGDFIEFINAFAAGC